MSAKASPMAGSPAPTGLRELALEDERIWTRVWACVGVEHQIPAPGDLLPATVGHHGLHVQRRPDGGLRAAFNVARNPLPMSIALGIVVSAVGLPIPSPVEKWLDLLGAAAAPCALFAIGLFLSDKSVRSGLAEAGLATVVKLLLQPLLAMAVLPLFVALDSVPGKVALLMAALPSAANAFVLARQFDIHVEQNSASVLLSTAFSVVTVSALLVLLRVS